jgi:hypothetical protein
MQFKFKQKFFLGLGFLYFIFSATGGSLAAGNPVVESPNSCKLMGDNLYNCTPFECDTSSPKDPDNSIHNKIVGFDKNGFCYTEQQNKSGEKVTCHYSEESRKFLSLRMKKYQSDIAHMPEISEMEENILADIFHNECDVSAGAVEPAASDANQELIEGDPEDDNDAVEDSPETGGNSGNGDDTVVLDPKNVKDNGDLLDTK